jgi:signal transduction histidine kinase
MAAIFTGATMSADRITDGFIASLFESSPVPIIAVDADIKQRTQKFNATYEADLPAIKGSSQRIGQVVTNLVQNACEALEDRKQGVAVQTAHDAASNRVVITVTDEGIGIDQGDIKHITDPFYTTRRESGGTGLGLSIASRIARDHDGFLEFKSEPGNGTVARLTIPIKNGSQNE